MVDDAPWSCAVSVTAVFDVTLCAVAVTVLVVCPAAMVMLDGRVSELLLELNVTEVATGAGWLSVTVMVEVMVGQSVDGLALTDDTVSGFTVTVPVADAPSIFAVTVAVVACTTF